MSCEIVVARACFGAFWLLSSALYKIGQAQWNR